jgi:hypothetical protein
MPKQAWRSFCDGGFAIRLLVTNGAPAAVVPSSFRTERREWMGWLFMM